MQATAEGAMHDALVVYRATSTDDDSQTWHAWQDAWHAWLLTRGDVRAAAPAECAALAAADAEYAARDDNDAIDDDPEHDRIVAREELTAALDRARIDTNYTEPGAR